MQNLFRLALPVFVIAAACGSDGGGGPAKPAISSSKPASDLSASEATDLCNYVSSLDFTPSKAQSCTFAAASLTQDKASCEAAEKKCEQEPEDSGDGDSGDGDSGDDCAKASDDLKDCSATVGEVETCFDKYSAALKSLIDNLSCDDAGKISQDDLNKAPAECTTLMQKCPKLFNDDSNANTGGDTVTGNGG